MKSKLLLCILLSGMMNPAIGQSAGDYRSKQTGNWNAATNWERFDGTNWVAAITAPTSADGVITIRAGHDITVNVSTTADQVIVQISGSLTMAANLTLNNGAGDDLTVNGTMHFISGWLFQPGTLVVATGGILNLSTGNPKLISAPIANNGIMNWSDGTIYFRATGVLLTNAGTFNITGNNSLENEGTDPGSAGTFVNSGTMTKTSNGITKFEVTAINNSGTINLNAGTLRSVTNPFTNTGNLNFNGGAFLNELNRVFNHNSGSVIGGTGSFTNNGTMNLNINQSFPSTLSFVVGDASIVTGPGNLTINSNFIMQGSIEGAGSLAINGNITWNGGSLKRPLSLPPAFSLTLATGSPKLIWARIDVFGTMNWQDGTIYFRSVGTLLNNEGTLQISGNNSLIDEIGASGTFVNDGIMTKTSTGTTDLRVAAVLNYGTINLNAGTLQNRSSPFTNTGTLNFNSGSFINESNNTFNHNSGSVITGTGSFTNNGTLSLNIDQTFPPTLSYAVGNSSLTTGPGNLTINNNFIMHGTIDGTGSLTINANITWNAGLLNRPLTVGPTYTLSFASPSATGAEHSIGAPLTNNGTMLWQDGTIRFKANIALTNAGTFTIINNNAFPNTITNENGISGSFVNSGIMTMNSTDLTLFNILFNNNNNAIIKGVGTASINSTFTNNGIIAPGLSPGIITMNNQELFSANSTLHIEIAGNGGAGQPTGHDQLQRNGNLILSGILTVNETGTVPAGDYTIISLTSGTITGTFSTTNLPSDYTIIYNSNNVVARKAQQTCIPAVSLAAVPGNTVCSGLNVTFTALPTNGGTPSYQWKLNGNNVGTNSSTYSSNTLANGDQVSVVMTSSLACASPTNATSNTIVMVVTASVTPSVSISANPGTDICQFTPVTFTATPTHGGATPSYQWKLNGNNIAGATSNPFTFNAVPVGSGISCEMTSSLACANPVNATSNIINMTVTPMVTPSVSISSNQGNTICAGTNVTFTATATNEGTAPLYQWFLNGSFVGTNSNTYSNNALANGDQVVVSMRSSLPCIFPDLVSSNAITMTVTTAVTPSVSISANPGNTICAGTNVTFTATPTNGGSTPLFQWRLNGNNVGTNSNTYANNTLLDGDLVSCVMGSSLACASATPAISNTIGMVVTASVTPSVSISANPGTDICQFTPVTFTATPTNGGATPSYQWKLNGNNIAGATSNPFTFNVVPVGSGISCEMTSSLACASPVNATSNIINMTVTPMVTPSVSISSNQGNTICAGTNVTFTATATNEGPTPLYQWFLNGSFVGTNSNTYSNNALANGDQVVVSMRSSLPCIFPDLVSSNAITMTVTTAVTPSVSISANPGNTICAGTNVTFTATPTNGGSTPSYQWKLNGTNVGNNSNTYSSSALANGDQVIVEMISSNACAGTEAATSNTIVMLVSPGNINASIVSIGNRHRCPQTLQANPGGNVTYQWYKNGVEISGATDRRYVAAVNGSYSVLVTKNSCSDMSSAVDVTSCPSGQTRMQTNKELLKEELPLVSPIRLLLYPNPAGDHVTIQLQDETASGEATVQLVTLHGQVLLTQKWHFLKGKMNGTLKLNGRWKDELYVMKVIMNKKIYVGKLIKISQ